MEKWSASEVANWISAAGFAEYTKIFIEIDNDIAGDVLVRANHELLKELAIPSIGHRTMLLKRLYDYKIQHNIHFEADDYTPYGDNHHQASASDQYSQQLNLLRSQLRDKDSSIQKLTTDIAKLSNELGRLRHELDPVWALIKEYKLFQKKTEAKKKSATPLSAGFASVSTGNLSSSSSTSSLPGHRRQTSSGPPSMSKFFSHTTPSAEELVTSINASPTSALLDGGSPGVHALRIFLDSSLNREDEPYKSFKVTVSDSCADILPNVLRKFKIDDDWRQYALFFHLPNKEKCLNFDEYPLLIYQEFKDQNPLILLKHIKQVKQVIERPARSHVNTAQQRSPVDFSKDKDTGKKQNFAVAIYEYQKEREDELNLAIGDQLQVIGHEDGWAAVLKDGVKYWVPSACLLDGDQEEDQTGERGVAIFDYAKNSSNELTVQKGDELTIFRKYNHWLLAECKGQTGWVPSCYIKFRGA